MNNHLIMTLLLFKNKSKNLNLMKLLKKTEEFSLLNLLVMEFAVELLLKRVIFDYYLIFEIYY
jgi:hypothetical protein